jgi:hypothetical protein
MLVDIEQARRIQEIFAGINMPGRKCDHYLVVCMRAEPVIVLKRNLEQWWMEEIDENVRRILCIGTMMGPRCKTIKGTTPEFTESMLGMNSVFECELLVRIRRLPVVL